MRWLVTGAGGMLAHDLVPTLAATGAQVTALPRAELDITDAAAVASAVAGHDVIVNCAAFARVDAAEDHEAEAFAVNAVGAAYLARTCTDAGARLVHFSTDYVFSGTATQPYAEDAPVAPRSAYGRSKAAGEWAVSTYCPRSWIVRTAWLYGAGGPNFVRTMARLAGESDHVRVVNDQVGQPTWTSEVAAAIVRLVTGAAPFGIWHATSGGSTTWHGFAQEIFRALGLDPARVLPITTSEYPVPAPRPAYSALGHDRWRAHRLSPLPAWHQSLPVALREIFPPGAETTSNSFTDGTTTAPPQRKAGRDPGLP